MPEVISKLRCLRCEYEWFPRTPKRPVVCPRCKHRDWDVSPWEVKDGIKHSGTKESKKKEG